MSHLIIIHIGESLPCYMIDCIEQVRLFTDIPIHVLINRNNNINLKHQEGINVFYLEDIPLKPEHEYFKSNSKLDKSFRNGFWRYTSERFFYLYDYVNYKNLENIFHIETDNLIYYDFTKHLPIFQSKLLWATFDSENRCIPGFLYFKNVTILQKLVIFLNSENNNDMITLSNFKDRNTTQCGYLPIITKYEDIPNKYYNELKNFNCLFDAACVGQYIGGVDARNKSGDTTGFINETCVFKCSNVKIEWKIKNNLKVPYLNDVPMINLHLHCKNLKKYRSDNLSVS
jgi:hypothetical protein